MKAISILTIATCAAGLAACGQGGADKAEGDAAGSAPAAAAAMEGPRPGLWRMTISTSMPGAPSTPPQEVCITQASFEPPANTGAAPGASCTDATFRREGDAMISSATCTTEGMTTHMNNRVTGDFSSHYVMETTVRMDPAPIPSMAEFTTTTTAERIGDCPSTGR